MPEMMPLAPSLRLFFASALLSIAPGPDNIFVLTQSALYGKKSGVLVTLGLCTGLVVHTTAVAFGVAAIFPNLRRRVYRVEGCGRHVSAISGLASISRLSKPLGST